MKILTGEMKGRTILFRPNPHLRPTADKVRKAIFDILQGELQDRKVLDLFSGTGALGIEAISNGAAKAVFVEVDAFQAGQIQKNLERLGLGRLGHVLRAEARKAMDRLSGEGAIFDFVFMDPPYEKGLALKSLEDLGASTLLKKEGIVIAETHSSENLPEIIEGLARIKEKKYGDTKILIYKAAGISYC